VVEAHSLNLHREGVTPMKSMLRVVSLTSVAMLAFAGNSLLCRVALRDTAIDAASFTSIRLISGALVLAVLMYARPGRAVVAGSWRAAALLFGYAAFFSFAYRQLSAATGALLLFGAVQTTMLGYGLLRGERLGRAQFAGLLIAVAGLIYMLLPGLSSPPLAGSIFMVCSGIAWGGYSLLGRGVSEPGAATAGNFLRAVPLTAALSLIMIGQASIDPPGALYAMFSGGIASGLGYVVWYAVLPSLRPVSAAIVQLGVPAIAAAGGVVLLSEQLTSRLLLASVAILGGIALVVLGRRRP
jgi:drug/metabolite transporter (DMT)-like permease